MVRLSKATVPPQGQARPVTMPVMVEGIPLALREKANWVVWRWDWAAERGCWAKVPYDANTGRKASSTKPTTWSTFEDAWNCHGDNPDSAGIGFMFPLDTGLIGVDLDLCRNPETGELTPRAQRILKLLPTYAEVSPSGTGIKLFLIGPWPEEFQRNRIGGQPDYQGKREGKFEVYGKGRYFTVTGQTVLGQPQDLSACLDGLRRIYEGLFSTTKAAPQPMPVTTPRPDDLKLLQIARGAKNGDKFTRLYDQGDYSGFASRSEADYALCGMLAFYTGPNAEQDIDRLFRSSGLMRPKWERTDYRQRTIRRALEGRTEFYTNGATRRREANACAGKEMAVQTLPTAPIQQEPSASLDTDISKRTEGGNGVPGRSEPNLALPDEVKESHDNPHRLARLFMAEHPHLRRYRQEWWRYQAGPDGACYVPVNDEVFKAFLTDWLRTQYERDYHHGEGEMRGRGEDAVLYIRKINLGTVTNTEQALRGKTALPDDTLMPSWLKQASMEKRGEYIALRNGLLSLDRLLDALRKLQQGNEPDWQTCLVPHSPDFFSCVCLPFDFNPAMDCPQWMAFLERNIEKDQERIRLLQEFFGLCLVQETAYQKFLMLVGEGANGKSVILAVLIAILGKANVAHVPLEVFGDRFQLSATLGKLVNIVAEVGELDKVAEGQLKAFTTGDPMLFDRKHKSPVSSCPTARLVIACNNPPRFSDRSGGVWRRMIYFPMCVVIPKEERKIGMDKPEWWAAQGELPGIFLWAVAGLLRLRQQGCFTEAKLCQEGVETCRRDSNPALVFLEEQTAAQANGKVLTGELYARYVQWCKDGTYRPMNERHFGQEVRRLYPQVKRRRQSEPPRPWFYEGITLLSGLS